MIRGGRVVEKRGTLSPRLSTSSLVPDLAATVLPVGETVEDAPSPLPTPSTAHVPVATVSPVVGAGGDSPSFPRVVLVRDDSSSFPPETFISSFVDVYHQDKRKRIVIDKEERTTPKRGFKEEDVDAVFEGVKKNRMALPQGTSGLIPTLPFAEHDPILDSSDWVERINIRSHQGELDPTILEKLLPPSAMAASVHRYWTSVWAGVAKEAYLPELIKMA
ncbi:hypothetical protein Adt_06174 [Abeliophyllum distichum]|uniref:Uncharacterized protein n=1 Tax=Abeliophyllum distichum TaxID=126358 RepID=A0ABD1V7G5_9LAMI